MNIIQRNDNPMQDDRPSKDGGNHGFPNPKIHPNDPETDKKNRPGHDRDRKDQVLEKINGNTDTNRDL